MPPPTTDAITPSQSPSSGQNGSMANCDSEGEGVLPDSAIGSTMSIPPESSGSRKTSTVVSFVLNEDDDGDLEQSQKNMKRKSKKDNG